MNQKELNELRRRFKPDRTAISKVYGCYVSSSRQIISYVDAPLGLLSQEEQEMYLNLLKKTLSGALGRNLIDIVFSTAQVADSDEHRLLQTLRQTELQDANARESLYRRIIDAIDMGESSYLILLAADTYDVPHRSRDDQEVPDASETVFRYFVCAICPVKDPTLALQYSDRDKEFRGSSTGHIAQPPALGFLFPAFDDRSTNIYNALYYSRGLVDIHEEFLTGVFRAEKVPMSSGAQKLAFSDVLCESLGSDCSLDLVRSVHGEIRERLLLHKESKAPEMPEIYVEDVDDILKNNGISDEKVSAFHEACSRQLGQQPALNPVNLMETNKFEMTTPQVKITVDPDYTDLIRTEVIDGRTCLVIPVDESVVVNGIDVSTGGAHDGEAS